MNSLDKNERIIKQQLETITVNTHSLKENVKKNLHQGKQPSLGQGLLKQRPAFPIKVVAASLSLCIILGGTIAATRFGGFAWLMSNFNPSYRNEVEPIEIVSEDQGIRMEVIGAKKTETNAIVYLSLQDVSGQNRLSPTTDLWDGFYIRTHSVKQSNPNSEAVSGYTYTHNLLHFDEQKNALYYEFIINSENSIIASPLQIGASLIAFSHDKVSGTLPMPKETKNDAQIISEKAIFGGSSNIPESENYAVLLPSQSLVLNESIDNLWISNIGIVDNMLHVQTCGIYQNNFGAGTPSLSLKDASGKTIPSLYHLAFFADQEKNALNYRQNPTSEKSYRFTEFVFPAPTEPLDSYSLEYLVNYSTGVEGEWRVSAELPK